MAKRKTDPGTPVLRVLLTGERSPTYSGRVINGPADVAAECADLVTADREHFVVLHLDAGNRVLARELVSVGTLTLTPLTCREVFKGAILNNSAAIIAVHNHPSGDPTPSGMDRDVTARLREAGNLLGIPLLDHVVVAGGGYRPVA